MAQVDPNIILNAVQQQRSGQSPFSSIQEIIQFQNLLEQQKLRQDKIQKEKTISDLISKNVRPTQEGVSLDNASFIQQLSQIDPRAALEQQSIVDNQVLQREKIRAQKEKALAEQKQFMLKASKAQLEKASGVQNLIGSAAGAVLSAPAESQQAVLDNQIDRLIDAGIITKEMLQSGQVPLSINPQNIDILRGIQESALSSKDQISFELERRKETGKEKSDRKFNEEQRRLKGQIDNRFIERLKKNRILSKEAIQDIQRFQTSTPTILAQVNDLESIIKKSSLADLKNPTSNASAEVASILGSLQFNVKELFELGALQAPDLELIDRLTGDPSRFNASNIRKESTAKRLGQMSKNIIRLFNNKINSFGFGRFDKNEILGLGSSVIDFSSIEEAEAANLPVGTNISVGGRRAVVE